jgi:tetratricopeptide (TPR) repeat protein
VSPHLQRASERYRVLRLATIAILAISCLCGCYKRRDAAGAFEHAMQTLEHGDIDTASREAERDYREFRSAGPEWEWKFVLLKARVLCWKGMSDRALDVLSSEPGVPPSADLTVQKYWLESVANGASHKFEESEGKLAEAERLCSQSDHPACAYVARARGRLEMERAHYSRAHDLFERSLTSARARRDDFLEANILLDLSWSAEQQTQFDEALDRANASRKIAILHGFADIAQGALGNMGWAYYKLGDSEKALKMFVEAGEQARKLGDMTDQVKWLTNAGYIHMDARELGIAEQSFQQSLKLAQQINSREDIVNSLIALAFVSERTGRLADAKRYADEVFSRARADGNKDDENYGRLVEARVAAQRHDIGTAEAAFHDVAQSPDAAVFLKWESAHWPVSTRANSSPPPPSASTARL